MLKKLINSLDSTLYVQIWKNRVKVTDIKTGRIFDEKPLIAVFENENKRKSVEAFGNNASLIKGKNITLNNPFRHERVLISNFALGEKFLQLVFKELSENRIFGPRPNVVMHPMEKLTGGITDIEANALKDMAIGAGARKVLVYEGSELSSTDFDFDIFRSK